MDHPTLLACVTASECRELAFRAPTPASASWRAGTRYCDRPRASDGLCLDDPGTGLRCRQLLGTWTTGIELTAWVHRAGREDGKRCSTAFERRRARVLSMRDNALLVEPNWSGPQLAPGSGRQFSVGANGVAGLPRCQVTSSSSLRCSPSPCRGVTYDSTSKYRRLKSRKKTGPATS